MDCRLASGGLAAIAAAALLALPQGEPADPADLAAFEARCQSGIANEGALAFCRCVGGRIERKLRSADEFRLAGGILQAIGEVHARQKIFGADAARAKTMIQTRFDGLSFEFLDSVTIDRKQDVLQVVTGNVRPCEHNISY